MNPPGVRPGTFWHRAMWPARLVTTLMFSPPLWTVSGPRPSLVVFEGGFFTNDPILHITYDITFTYWIRTGHGGSIC